MGFMIDGKWDDSWYDTKKTGGKFVRMDALFRNWITADGSPGPTGKGGFKAEKDRYHLYVSLACPWAHRTLIFRKLKGLEDMIGVSVVNSYMSDEEGWTFKKGPGVVEDSVNHAIFLHEIYAKADPNYSGIVSVPTLWDKKTNTIVSNESPEIIRMLNSAFDEIGALEGDFYPSHLQDEIDAINDLIYNTVNNGVYKAGFATTQTAYEDAVYQLFDTLDKLEALLSKQRYLVDDEITEADWRLFTTLIRFDAVYYGHFKCNIRQLRDYPNLWNYTLELAQVPGVMETIDLEYTKAHYYGSHDTINPHLIVPVGPEINLMQPHNRDRAYVV